MNSQKTQLIMPTPKQILAYIFLFATLLLSCSDDDPEPVNEEELITTVVLVFQPLNATGNPEGNASVFSWIDRDEDGPIVPVISDITLSSNTTYKLTVQLLNESVNPAVNISEEVLEEGTEHQFFFGRSNGLNLNVTYADNDKDGLPVGLTNNATTGNASTGEFTVTLRHEPQKNASGVKSGDITNAGGETDVQVSFPVTIN
ncbi:hypothetical protein [Chryseosolibacter indicus]|uniref:Type 1 periplasmic binding fold superfamily protein n=1 Tax=Chryseosolibacter indicus TaxID=2782351 RepID=A0ABS5VS84_9BACT|nr:hypothetical protein [Chryseosolibacter indicus]MBT1704211.1 hypothetical protein [Chryseosolibacter indicus]